MLTQTVGSPILRAGKTQFEEYIQHFLHFFTFYLDKKECGLYFKFLVNTCCLSDISSLQLLNE